MHSLTLRRLLLILSCISCLLFQAALFANQESPDNNDCKLSGKVIKVTDGDTVKIIDQEKTIHKIRLAGIDAPENGQPFGKASGKYLSKMINQKTVCVDWQKLDKYKRLVGVISFSGEDINHKMVEAGLAWHYKKYQHEQAASDRESYSNSEINARKLTTGLWSMPDPITPSDWRAGFREAKKDRKPPKPFTCGTKRFCKQMTNCSEACYYLQSCNVSRLDGNDDGIPCNSQCTSKCE